MTLPTATCSGCGKSYQPWREDQRFCTRACRELHRHEERVTRREKRHDGIGTNPCSPGCKGCAEERADIEGRVK